MSEFWKIGTGATLRICSQLISLLTVILITRTVDINTFGHYSAIVSTATLAAGVFQFGFHRFLIYEYGLKIDQSNKKIKETILTYRKELLACVAISAVIATFLISNFNNSFEVLIHYALLAALGFSAIKMAHIRLFSGSVQSMLPNYFIRPLVFLILILITHFFWGQNINSNMLAMTFLLAICVAQSIPFRYRRVPPNSKDRGSNDRAPDTVHHIRHIFYITVSAGSTAVLLNLTVIMGERLIGESEAAVLRVLVLILGALGVLQKALNYHYATTLTRVTETDLKIFSKDTRKVFAISILTSAFSLIGCIWGGDEFLSFVFGEIYAVGSFGLICIGVALLVGALCGPVENFLILNGFARAVTHINAATLMLFIGFCIYFRSNITLNFIGACLSFTLIVQSLLQAYLAHSKKMPLPIFSIFR